MFITIKISINILDNVFSYNVDILKESLKKLFCILITYYLILFNWNNNYTVKQEKRKYLTILYWNKIRIFWNYYIIELFEVIIICVEQKIENLIEPKILVSLIDHIFDNRISIINIFFRIKLKLFS